MHLGAEDPALLDRLGELARRDRLPTATPTGAAAGRSSTTSPASPTWSTRLVADGVRLTRVEPHEPTLEDLYFAVRRDAPRRRAAADRRAPGPRPGASTDPARRPRRVRPEIR